MIQEKLIKSFSIYPALWFCGIYSIGIVCGWYFLDHFFHDWSIFAAIGLCLFAVLFHFRLNRLFIPTIILLIFLLGTINIYQAFAQFKPDDIIIVGTKKIQSFSGWVSKTHYRKDGNHQYILELMSVERDSQILLASGQILLKQRRLQGL